MSRAREETANLQVAVMKETEEKTKLLDKLKVAEIKAKKHSEAVNEAKRKQELIKAKNKEVDALNE